MSSLPAKNDPRWASLIAGGAGKPIKLLALKFMLTRMSLDVKKDPSSLARNVDELHGFFAKNPKMVETDLGTLFG